MAAERQRKLLFTNCVVWTGEIGSAAPRQVLVEGNRIAAVATEIDGARRKGAVRIDCAGASLLPGLVDGHSHLSFLEKAEIVEFGFVPVEEHTLQTMHNARRVLLGGFTSCIGASSAKPRLDIAVRNEINAGRIPGPRLLAATQEITVTGGLGDERLLHMYRESVAAVLDGPDEIRKYVRTMSREGCDIVKLNISGNQGLASAPPKTTLMTPAEVEAAVTAAHAYDKRVMAHARSSESVQLSVRHGVEFINHCEFADAATIDMLEEHKQHVFLGPAFGLLHNLLYEAERWGMTPQKAERLGLPQQVESCAAVYSELRKRGLRVLIGGDYGFAWTPHGTNARDLSHFVKWFGYTPEEALVCATINGAQAMRMESEIGRIREGYLADLIIVKGRPFEDADCIRPENIPVVLKDGEPHGSYAWPIANAPADQPIVLN